MKYRIRFNKTRGQDGRGSEDHAWRIFDETGKEYICKNIDITVPSYGEKEVFSEDWNIVAFGQLKINKDTSTIVVI